MEVFRLLNLTDLRGVSVREVEEVARAGIGVEFALCEGGLEVDFSEFLSGDRYQLWNHLILLVPNFPWQVQSKDLFFN